MARVDGVGRCQGGLQLSVGGIATERLAEAVRHASSWLDLKRLSNNR